MYKYNYEFKPYNPQQFAVLNLNYIIAVPEDYVEGEQLPMIVFLHGHGERGADTDILTRLGLPKYLKSGLSVRAIILAPQIPDFIHTWNNLMDQTMVLIKSVAEEYKVDTDRISLTGVSMGGFGTWDLAITNPDYFSAIAPICGGAMSWRCDRLINIPIRTVHGDADSVVPLSNTIEMVDKINALGGNAACIILHGVDHNSWDFAYEQTNIIEWLVKQDRKNKENNAWNS